MKNAIQNPRIIAGTVTFLLVLTLMGLISYYETNQTLSDGLNSEKLKSEKILSEKLSLDKEIIKLKQSIANLQGKNTNLDKMLSTASSKIAMTEGELKKMQKENASLKQYKQQVADIQKIKSDLEGQIASLTNSLNSSNMEKESLNKTVVDLQGKNKSLMAELNQMQIASLDNIRIEAFKKNKLTISAKRTNKIDVNFQVPATAGNNLQFKITDPTGRLLTPMDGTIAFNEPFDETPILTAAISNTLYIKQTKQVKFEYKPKKKLKAGVYKIEVLNEENVYMGSLQVRLK